jgi:cysteinyl-tRNA synthetase
MSEPQLRLYSTLTRTKEAFAHIDENNVRMYVCGPTVYDFAHIGNARPAIVFDVLFRLLRHLYGEDRVTYVRNITDVDDKINTRAARDYPGLPLNEAIRKVTEETNAQFQADVARADDGEDEVVLPAGLDAEEAVGAVHGVAGHQHQCYESRTSERGQQAQSEQNSSAELGRRRGERV